MLQVGFHMPSRPQQGHTATTLRYADHCTAMVETVSTALTLRDLLT